MRFGRTIRIYLLIAAIACSSFVGAAEPCGGPHGASIGAQAVTQDAANQHHHGAATQQQADRTECRCCDDCAVACVFSACNPGATSFVSVDTNYDRPNRYDPVAISAHDGPVLFPPLRPPIQSS